MKLTLNRMNRFCYVCRMVIEELMDDESDLKEMTELLLSNYRKMYSMESISSRYHDRSYTEEIQKRLLIPHVATLSNSIEKEGNVLILQRVVNVP